MAKQKKTDAKKDEFLDKYSSRVKQKAIDNSEMKRYRIPQALLADKLVRMQTRYSLEMNVFSLTDADVMLLLFILDIDDVELAQYYIYLYINSDSRRKIAFEAYQTIKEYDNQNPAEMFGHVTKAIENLAPRFNEINSKLDFNHKLDAASFSGVTWLIGNTAGILSDYNSEKIAVSLSEDAVQKVQNTLLDSEKNINSKHESRLNNK